VANEKPRFVVDVCAGQVVANTLQSFGLDLKSIVEINPKMDDPDILEIANQENRILVTMDKDFGELVFKSGLVHAGVLTLRLQDESAEEKERVTRLIASHHLDELAGNFSVYRKGKLRVRRRVLQ
jgi:predicted nuclease of predicted toxin-antitoxin system